MEDLADQHVFENRGADKTAPAGALHTAPHDAPSPFAARTRWWHHIPAVLAAGLICGLLAAMFSISAAALLFSTVLGEQITLAIGICLFGSIVLSIVIALFSSCPGTVSVTQEVTVVTLAVIAASIHATMFAAHGEAEILATIVVMIGLATSITGLALFVMGTLRLGRLIRFIPYPVIAGFLAGMGWLIVAGALAVVLGEALTRATLPTLLDPATLAKWVPAVAFALFVDTASRRSGNPLVAPAALVASLAFFHAVVWIMDMSVAQLQLQGWVFAPPQEARILLPFEGNPLAAADWTVIWYEAPKVIVLVAVSAAALLFASSGIEMSVKRDIDLDVELRAAGVANMFAGAGGGAAGFQGLGLTMLAHQLGAPYRITGVLVAGVCTAVLFFGATLLSFVPIPLFGGLLLWIGGGLLYEWLIAIRARISRREYLIVLLIVGLIVSVGLLEGVVVGIFAAAALFTLEYARVEVVKYAVTGAELHSRIEHADDDRAYLTRQGRHTVVLRLQGFVFFGSVYRLHQFILDRIACSDTPNIRFLILDCRDVTGFDSSAILSLEKVRDMILKDNGELIVSGLKPAIAEKLHMAVGPDRNQRTCRCFDTVDQAMAWCEDRLLQGWQDRPTRDHQHSLADHLNREIDCPDAFENMRPYLERVDIAPQTRLIRQGAQSSDIFFIERGTVIVQLDAGGMSPVHLRTLGPGTIVGEMSFFLKRPRTASAVAQSDTTVWRLSRDNLQRMTTKEPQLAYAFHSYLLRIVSERLNQTNRLVSSLTN
ncbi:SulP family inorganic anion transporter [uncultured Roseobacter sp.]|uniref:SulP family inorganic anion transporter n=1 Tax=uncultured Roseobacter sp. TaxID=114847 RepID=UPI002633B4B3|nr:SulP family inorganic anion transporter [uncultured Roseobacter sp.]